MNQIEAILSYFNTDDPVLRTRALRAAAQYGGAEAEEILLTGLQDANVAVRGVAIEGIAELGIERSSNPQAIITALLRILEASGNQASVGLIEALIRMIRPNPKQLVDPLLWRFDCSYAIANAIVDTDYAEVFEDGVLLLLGGLAHNEETVRKRAYYGLQYTLTYVGDFYLPYDVEVQQSVLLLLNSADYHIRAVAAELLGYAASDVDVTPLRKLRQDDNMLVQISAIAALAKHGYTYDVAQLYQLSSTHADPLVRYKAAQALYELAPLRFVDLVTAGAVHPLDDAQYHRVATALQNLSRKGVSKQVITIALTNLLKANQL